MVLRAHRCWQVEETFGPVQAPLYAVRRCKPTEGALVVEVRLALHSVAPQTDRTAKLCGSEVFFVSGRSTFITDVERLRVKGYDASGKEDEEVEAEEFSDDEKARGFASWRGHELTRPKQEAEARRATKKSHKRTVEGDSAPRAGGAEANRGGREGSGGARGHAPQAHAAAPPDLSGYPAASGLAQQQLLLQQQWQMYMQWQAMQMQMQGGGGWPFPPQGGGPFPWAPGPPQPPPSL